MGDVGKAIDNVTGGMHNPLTNPLDLIDPLRTRGVFTGEEGVAAPITNAINGQDATRRALEAQRGATGDANRVLGYERDVQDGLFDPYHQAGLGALKDITNPDLSRSFTMDDFKADPGYQFALDEGEKAISRAAAARGLNNSGATLKALTAHGMNLANQEYGKVRDRFVQDQDRRFGQLNTVMGAGQYGTTGRANASSSYGANVSNNITGQGNAEAAAHIAQGNRFANLTGQGLQIGSMLAFSDERVKKDVRPISKKDLAELRKTIRPFLFKYKEGFENGMTGDVVGVMAQDLQKSKLGRTLLTEDENGLMKIDIRRVMSLFLATLGEA